MGTGPKEVEEKMERMLTAWKTLAPAKNFGGMTVDEFELIVVAARDARAQIDRLEDQLTRAITAREEADDNFLEKADLVVNGVRADATEGPDSALYEAFGYTRKSERRSGLTRKRKPPTEE